MKELAPSRSNHLCESSPPPLGEGTTSYLNRNIIEEIVFCCHFRQSTHYSENYAVLGKLVSCREHDSWAGIFWAILWTHHCVEGLLSLTLSLGLRVLRRTAN